VSEQVTKAVVDGTWGALAEVGGGPLAAFFGFGGDSAPYSGLKHPLSE
jgi:hypothetical protein